MLKHQFRWFAALLVLIFAITGCDLGSDEGAEQITETVIVVPIPDGPDVTVDEGQQQTELERPEGPALHGDAKDERPPGVSAEELEQIENSRPPGIGPPQPVGGAENLQCPKRLVRNFSSRASGSRVSMIVIHYTVSSPGTLDAIRGLFDTPSFGASSHIGLEGSGRCQQWVEYSKKAWTQGAFNSVAESVEIIARGNEPRSWWLKQPIIARGLLASWIADRLRANGLPARFVNPDGCTPRAGWTDHNNLECSNSHTDVQPNFPYDVVKRQVLQRFNVKITRVVWRISSANTILFQTPAQTLKGVSGVDRVGNWIKSHEIRVRQMEEKNGAVGVRKVTITG